ncbi:putative 8-amino-7-oxononanoate synthase [Candidatus Terasakiella magnetica]|uniref:8-amino-7-ketopelargonate synthase n=1 Tax=Candidatus Terasakiella magnetica TaxID=1867952 RepID=A0A1C3RC88_9PROT|nr:8-amino-7-oxononanoate synthase [Candidatus Terasakiella magnetica]SCA54881.1 putative 8-amino-7-oxononanoate synthase [Candidatus Terasakiella magnetica]
MSSYLDDIYGDYVTGLEKQGLRRSLRVVGKSHEGRTYLEGEEIINFSSNNYMGLAQHPLLIERACEWAQGWGTGSMASRLVCGTMELHERVEARLVEAKGGEAALIFNSGFQANSAILTALLDKEVLGAEPLVFCDRLNHASMHHGLKAAGIRQIRYRHNDLNHLEELLKKHENKQGDRFILSESVFSMDGDQSDVDALIALAEKYNAQLYLDEAHATGVLGQRGYGLCAGKNVAFKMGTFSKALGGFGAYLVCSQKAKDFLVNRCSGLIYSTSLPPAVLGAMDAALELVPQLDKERETLLENAQYVRDHFVSCGFDVGDSSTQIIPLIIGDEEKTLAMAKALEAENILGIAIRPPTVPKGTSRIRLALSAIHRREDIERLCQVVASFKQ